MERRASHPCAHDRGMTAEPRPDPFDAIRDDLIDKIDRYGYSMIVVGTGECAVPGCTCRPEPYPYAYSLGMGRYDHPEMVVFGLSLEYVNGVARPVYEAAAAGRPLAAGRELRHRLTNGAVISLVPVPELWLRRDVHRIGGWFDVFGAGGPLPTFVQICWADRFGAMPWERECDPRVAALQPLLADHPTKYPPPPRNIGRHRRRR